jgi:uncharacterized membrane protein YfcA
MITPALNIFMGLEMNIAVGTSACQVLGASAFSLYHHLDRRMFGIKVAMCAGLGIPFGSYCGANIVKMMQTLSPWHINGMTISPVNILLLSFFAVFLLLVWGWMFYDNFCRKQECDDSEHIGFLYKIRIPPFYRFRTIPAGEFSIPVLVCLGVVMGFISGMLGIGGGVIMLPMLFYMVGQETKFATQTDMMLIFVSGAFSTIFHAMNHNINYVMAIALMCGALFGTNYGAKLQKRVTGKSIRKYFVFVVIAAWLLVIYKLFFIFI